MKNSDFTSLSSQEKPAEAGMEHQYNSFKQLNCLFSQFGKIVNSDNDELFFLIDNNLKSTLLKHYNGITNKKSPQEFVELVTKSDSDMGLSVNIYLTEGDEIIYQIENDPFPGLKEHMSHNHMDELFLNLKIQHLLGDNWHYTTKKHLWNDDKITEYTLQMRSN